MYQYVLVCTSKYWNHSQIGFHGTHCDEAMLPGRSERYEPVLESELDEDLDPILVRRMSIHAKNFSIFTGFFSTHTGFFSIHTGFFSTRVSITLERSRLFCGLFATTAPKNYGYRRSKAWIHLKSHEIAPENGEEFCFQARFSLKKMEKMLSFRPDFSNENGEKSGIWKMEKNPVHEIWMMKNGEKSDTLSPKNAGTWRKNCGIPGAPAKYIRRPPRPGKLVESVLAEEGCRMWEARQEERGNFFLQKWSRPGTRWT